jgi:prevent-host-death family protein
MTMINVTEISASQFKARCLALLDEVAESGGELVVTKHGRPVAKLVSADEEISLRGSVEFKVDDQALIAPIDSVWDAA